MILTPYSDLPFHQPFKEIKAITITLQRPNLASSSIFETELFSQQQSPIPGNAFDSRPYTPFSFQGDDLISVQPMLVIQLFR